MKSLTTFIKEDWQKINKADKIILPGVGSFTDCLNAIRSIDGVYESLQEQVINKKKYFMGICVGMQLLADIGYENEKNDGFGWVSGTVEKMKVPLDLNGMALMCLKFIQQLWMYKGMNMTPFKRQ